MSRIASAGLPNEVCGILGGVGDTVQSVIPITNILYSATRFQMDAEEQLKAFLQLEKKGLEMIATFHSHPNGPRQPSMNDIEKHYYPGTAVVILAKEGEWKINAFLIEGTLFRQITINEIS